MISSIVKFALLFISIVTSSSSSSSDPRPNILFLMTDQQRFDTVSPIHRPLGVSTPNFDRLLSDGVWFSRAYSSTPTCTPARSALLTGLSPWNHGMLGYGAVAYHYKEEYPRELSDGGYLTAIIGKDHYGWNVTSNSAVKHGFNHTLIYDGLDVNSEKDDYDNWFAGQLPNVDPMCTNLSFNDYRGRSYALSSFYHPTAWTGRNGADWIRRYYNEKHAKPFMLKVSFHRPHSPYDPPQEWLNTINATAIPPPFRAPWSTRFRHHQTPPDPAIWNGDLGDDQSTDSRRHYLANIAFIDSELGTILDTLEATNLLNNTFIVYLSDHGDMLMDHAHWRKGFPYESSSHIPMMVRWPPSMDHRVSVPRGSVIDSIVELRDIRPTFLDVANVTGYQKVDGSSLLKLLNGKTSDWRKWIDMEHDIVYNQTVHWNALTDGTMKYIYNAFYELGSCDDDFCAEQLFNVTNDPHELNDLSRDANYKGQLLLWRSRMVEQFENENRGEKFVKDGQLQRRVEGMLYSPNYPGTPPPMSHHREL